MLQFKSLLLFYSLLQLLKALQQAWPLLVLGKLALTKDALIFSWTTAQADLVLTEALDHPLEHGTPDAWPGKWKNELDSAWKVGP